MSNLLLLGPPAVGKSTIAKRVVGLTAGVVTHCGFDSVVEGLCRSRRATIPYSDELIDEAAIEFFGMIPPDGNLLVEFTHHDYVSLISHKVLKCREFVAVVVLVADYELLSLRNQQREGPVPELYLKRCAAATATLLKMGHEIDGVEALVFDTALISSATIANELADQFRPHINR